jgi:hypothetical protein
MSHVNRGQKTLDLWNRSKNQLERTNFKRKGKSETTGRVRLLFRLLRANFSRFPRGFRANFSSANQK